MLSGFWSLIGLLNKIWDFIAAALGYMKTVEHQKTVKEIDEAAKTIEKPDATDAEREDAAHELEDIANRHT